MRRQENLAAIVFPFEALVDQPIICPPTWIEFEPVRREISRSTLRTKSEDIHKEHLK
jgi:hypothetical protein